MHTKHIVYVYNFISYICLYTRIFIYIYLFNIILHRLHTEIQNGNGGIFHFVIKYYYMYVYHIDLVKIKQEKSSKKKKNEEK